MFKTLQKNVTAAGTPEQLSADLKIRSGVPVTVKAKKANTGKIWIGASSADADNGSTAAFRLEAGTAIDIPGIDNLNQIWIDADTNGEGVEVLCNPNL